MHHGHSQTAGLEPSCGPTRQADHMRHDARRKVRVVGHRLSSHSQMTK